MPGFADLAPRADGKMPRFVAGRPDNVPRRWLVVQIQYTHGGGGALTRAAASGCSALKGISQVKIPIEIVLKEGPVPRGGPGLEPNRRPGRQRLWKDHDDYWEVRT